MIAVEEILLAASEQRQHREPLTKPFMDSALAHAVGLTFVILLLAISPKPLEPIRVLEISVMGSQDLALKGTEHDFNKGPLADKTLMSQPAGAPDKAASGNTSKVSRSLSSRRGDVAALMPPKPVAGGALFAETNASPAEHGIGREKIYMAASKARSAPMPKRGESGGGEGLVGAAGAAIDLNAKRGSGQNGGGRFIGGGMGHVDGGSQLMRRGEAIVVREPAISEGLAKARVKMPPPSDDFFSIRGPLSRRKILKMSLPRYPRWAEEAGVEAQVSVWLAVTADGRVKSDLYVQQTSSFPEFDSLVLDAVKKMLFAPLGELERGREETGVATFNFKLKKGGLAAR